MANRTLSEQEMIDILEEIARNAKNAASQVAAIKMLRDWDAGEKPNVSEFGKLYEITTPLRTKSA